MRAVIPYKKAGAKSRLSPVLSLREREEFVELMLSSVLRALKAAGIEKIDIISPSIYGLEEVEAQVILDEADLNEALNAYLEKAKGPVLIIMADLPLLSASHIKEIVSSNKDICIVPGKGGGTNLIFLKNPSDFQVKYYGSSFLAHCAIAEAKALSFEVYDSLLASTDIDEPDDLVELLVHGKGPARDYINQKFNYEVSRGRVKLNPIE
ncbi:MAG: 2-phospho-L-lactate guanylyltransferase [Methanosarcinaceae archaeon]|nr:2-phospho-L-lactate guanylyltransferase [Methanosarcinaceae archaeon]MDD4750115.1 2-phospho-L-lactate guanylyltransferase [Methanosarcinaceae archaeon]